MSNVRTNKSICSKQFTELVDFFPARRVGTVFIISAVNNEQFHLFLDVSYLFFNVTQL